jgi:hypothetical protein
MKNTDSWIPQEMFASGLRSKGVIFMLAFDHLDPPDFDRLFTNIQRRLAQTPGMPTQIGPPEVAPPRPVSLRDLADEESRLGFRLPPILRRLYLEIGNGGFGPGGGLLSLRQISPKVDQTVATLYHQLQGSRRKRGGTWQEGVVPFAEWGDFIFSCVDLAGPGGTVDPTVVRYEPNMPEAATFQYLKGAPFRGAGLIPESERLSKWFDDWIDGREMFERPYHK